MPGVGITYSLSVVALRAVTYEEGYRLAGNAIPDLAALASALEFFRQPTIRPPRLWFVPGAKRHEAFWVEPRASAHGIDDSANRGAHQPRLVHLNEMTTVATDKVKGIG